jgi:hypothetical protein
MKKFSEFYEIRKFINLYTTVLQLSLSCTTLIKAVHFYPTFLRSILILFSLHQRFSVISLLHIFIPNTLSISLLPYTCHMSHQSLPLYFINQRLRQEQCKPGNCSSVSFLHYPVTASLPVRCFRPRNLTYIIRCFIVIFQICTDFLKT